MQSLQEDICSHPCPQDKEYLIAQDHVSSLWEVGQRDMRVFLKTVYSPGSD